jgi:hypothetical protein
MPQTYKILGQALATPNTLTNVYVTDASTSAIINSIYITNQGTFTSNAEIILRPINEARVAKHIILPAEQVPGADTFVLNLGITMGPNMILAANTSYSQNAIPVAFGVSNVSYGAFGLELT